MFNRIFNVLASSGGDFFVLFFALLTVYASFSAGEPEAYIFPRLVSVLMLLFCGLNFVRRVMVRFAGEPRLTLSLIKKIAPGVVVIAAYLLLAEDVGFYLSAMLAFFALSFLYSQTRRFLPTVAVSGAVIIVLYLMFSIALKVQVPREFFL